MTPPFLASGVFFKEETMSGKNSGTTSGRSGGKIISFTKSDQKSSDPKKDILGELLDESGEEDTGDSESSFSNLFGNPFVIEEEEDEYEIHHHTSSQPEHILVRLSRQPLFWVVAVLLMVIALAAGWNYQMSRKAATQIRENWVVEMKENGTSRFLPFGDNVVKFDRDGASYYNAAGEMVWSQGFDMMNPYADQNGDFLVLADQKGNHFYVFNREGCTGSGETTMPISRAAISGKGMVALILEDTTANYVQFFNRSGGRLDIEIKTVLSGDGYPLDVALSEDGTILAASYVYLSAGTLLNKVVFYNFSESGKNMVQRIVGGFEQYTGSIVADVVFLSQKRAVAFADDRVSFYSLKNEVSPELTQERFYDKEIKKVFYGEGLVGIVTEAATGMGNNQVDVYTASGSLKMSLEVDLTFTDAAFSGDMILFTNEHECRIFDAEGSLKYSGELSGSITRLVSAGGNGFIQIGGQTMRRLTIR